GLPDQGSAAGQRRRSRPSGRDGSTTRTRAMRKARAIISPRQPVSSGPVVESMLVFGSVPGTFVSPPWLCSNDGVLVSPPWLCSKVGVATSVGGTSVGGCSVGGISLGGTSVGG